MGKRMGNRLRQLATTARGTQGLVIAQPMPRFLPNSVETLSLREHFDMVCPLSKSNPSSLDKVEHVDEVGVVDVPALDAHDVHKHVEVAAWTHAAVEDDPEKKKISENVKRI